MISYQLLQKYLLLLITDDLLVNWKIVGKLVLTKTIHRSLFVWIVFGFTLYSVPVGSWWHTID